jgi:hypothetical protein
MCVYLARVLPLCDAPLTREERDVRESPAHGPSRGPSRTRFRPA